MEKTNHRIEMLKELRRPRTVDKEKRQVLKKFLMYRDFSLDRKKDSMDLESGDVQSKKRLDLRQEGWS